MVPNRARGRQAEQRLPLSEGVCATLAFLRACEPPRQHHCPLAMRAPPLAYRTKIAANSRQARARQCRWLARRSASAEPQRGVHSRLGPESKGTRACSHHTRRATTAQQSRRPCRGRAWQRSYILPKPAEQLLATHHGTSPPAILASSEAAQQLPNGCPTIASKRLWRPSFG